MDIRSKKFLVIRLSSLGDVVLTTPVARLLSKAGGSVDVLTKAQYLSIWHENPYVEKVLDYNSIDLNEVSSWSYDYIIDLQNNLRSRRLTVSVSSRVMRIKKDPIQKWMYLKLGINKLSKLNVAERNIAVLKELGIFDDGDGLDICVQESKLPSAIDRSKNLIVVAMGGTYITKRIPTDLVNGMIDERDKCEYVLIGGSDTERQRLTSSVNTHNLIAKTTLQQSITLLSRADLVITGDTGMMHIAAAMQKPIIVIWGSTSMDFGFYPYYGSKNKQTYSSVSIKGLSCRPCSKYGRKDCPKGHMNCLNLINGQMVRQEVMRFLSI